MRTFTCIIIESHNLYTMHLGSNNKNSHNKNSIIDFFAVGICIVNELKFRVKALPLIPAFI